MLILRVSYGTRSFFVKCATRFDQPSVTGDLFLAGYGHAAFHIFRNEKESSATQLAVFV